MDIKNKSNQNNLPESTSRLSSIALTDFQRVKDLYLAAFFYSEGLELRNVEREGKVCWFLFSDKNKCDQLTNLYWKNQATSKTKSFTDAIRTLKDLIYSS